MLSIKETVKLMPAKKILEEKSVILSRFYWKDLLKITSKTQDATILIFYFGLNEEKMVSPLQNKLAEILCPPSGTKVKDYPSRHKKHKKVEVRYQFETVEKAKECISCVKETYKSLKQKVC